MLLSEPGEDFTGGEFVLTEQRPRMQSRPGRCAAPPRRAVMFAVHHRPVRGTRGSYRVVLRHGVSTLRSGHRHTLGIIFHVPLNALAMTPDLFEKPPGDVALAEGALCCWAVSPSP